MTISGKKELPEEDSNGATPKPDQPLSDESLDELAGGESIPEDEAQQFEEGAPVNLGDAALDTTFAKTHFADQYNFAPTRLINKLK